MAENSKIQWTDHTKNLWWGCVEVSPGCDHCYAKDLATRWGRDVWGVNAPRFFTKEPFKELDKWQREADKAGIRKRVFVQSMSDICEVLPFEHPNRQQMDNVRQAFFEKVANEWGMLDFQLLTKRVGNYPKVVPARWLGGAWPANAWAGISVVNQTEADRDIPKLLALPAPVKFLSVEPQIGPIDLTDLGCRSLEHAYGGESSEWKRLQWVIVGGESGSQARPFDPDWARSLIEQCDMAGVACFVKQMGRRPVGLMLKDNHGGDWSEWPEDLRVREFPTVCEAVNA